MARSLAWRGGARFIRVGEGVFGMVDLEEEDYVSYLDISSWIILITL